MGDDREYRTFRRAVWLGGGLRAKSAWPVLVVLLPLIWELVKAWMASRTARVHGTPEEVADGLRLMAAELPAEPWARRALAQAEQDVAGGDA